MLANHRWAAHEIARTLGEDTSRHAPAARAAMHRAACRAYALHALETAAVWVDRARGLTLLWLTTHDGTPACAFYEAVGYTKLGTMPSYSFRPDGTLAPGAFYYKELRRSS